MSRYILTVECPEKIGIVRSVSDFLFQHSCSVVEAAEFADLCNQRFFARWEFVPVPANGSQVSLPELEEKFRRIANDFEMKWGLFDSEKKPRLLIAVSRHGHCLNDLLHRSEDEAFPADIVAVVSNHEDFREKVEWYGLCFHYLPVTPETKAQQEQEILQLMHEGRIDLLVLARYMQILSDKMCNKLAGQAINIHHSFLPSFKGAKPYHQAFERGVKITGATAHYVTRDLDEGPIIEQDVQRIEHNYDVARLMRLGKNIESIVLARAVYLHCQRRVFLNGNRTVILR